MTENEYTVAEAARIAGRDPQGKKAVTIICGRHDPPELVAAVQDDPRFGFVLRTGGARGQGRTVTGFPGPNPTNRYIYVCSQCGDLRPDPSLLAETIAAYLLTGAHKKLVLRKPAE